MSELGSSMPATDRYGFIVAGIQQIPTWLRGALLVSIISIAICLAREFDGYEMYVLEPGVDEGFVFARTYSWWGLTAETFELTRRRNVDGDLSWHVRKRGEGAHWQPLYGQDESGNLVLWFPRN